MGLKLKEEHMVMDVQEYVKTCSISVFRTWNSVLLGFWSFVFWCGNLDVAVIFKF